VDTVTSRAELRSFEVGGLELEEDGLWREEEVGDSREGEVDKPRCQVSNSSSGLKLFAEDKVDVRRGGSSSLNNIDPVQELKQSKLFQIENQVGFSYSFHNNGGERSNNLVKAVELSNKVPKENIEGCQ